MNIVIVEDETSLNTYISSGLVNRGYLVSQFSNWEDFEVTMLNQNIHYDLLILDRMLFNKEVNTSEILKIKNRFPSIGIIILSAIGTSSEKSKMLDAGVDDYLSKPFSIDELISRIQALTRRMQKQNNIINTRNYGNLKIDLDKQIILINEKPIEFSRKEFQLLKLLLDSPSRVYSRHQLLDRIWDIHTEIESNVVEVTVKNVRKKLENAEAAIKILSKRNVGYWVEI